MMTSLPLDKKIILFDGVCNLCDNTVQYIIKKDKKDIFRFVSLQSDLGLEIQKYLGIANRNIDSIVLYIPNKAYYIKSEAAIEIAKELPLLNWLFIFKIVPTALRNVIYDYIAKNRYRWYGQKDNCMLPTPEVKEKFLD